MSELTDDDRRAARAAADIPTNDPWGPTTIYNVYAAGLRAGRQRWIPVSERLPDAVPVIAYGVNSMGMERRLRAEYVRKGTREDDGDYEPIGEYDAEKDAYFWPEGWYEWNDGDDTHWLIDIPITHWQPLPPAPPKDE